MTRRAKNNTAVFSQVGWWHKTRADPVTLTSPGRLSDPQGHDTTPEADAIMLDDLTREDTGLPPESPTSIYKYYDKRDVLIYVGITSRGTSRNREHNADKEWWPYVRRQEVEHRPTRPLALAREKQLIIAHRPPFNRQHNPDCGSLREIYLRYVQADQEVPDAHERIFEKISGQLPLAVMPPGPDRVLVLRTHIDHEPVARRLIHNPMQPGKVFTRITCVGRVTEITSKGPYTRLIVNGGKKMPFHARFGVARLRMMDGKKQTYRIHNISLAVGDEHDWWND